MCLQIGNKVAVIDEPITGKITAIQNNTITIIDKEGMTFSYLASELVKTDEYQQELSKFSTVNNSLFIAKQQVNSKKSKSAFKKQKNEIVMEVDLHIEKLVKNAKGLDNYDILSLQIATAKRKVEYCIGKKISKLVFIHGVGEGVLKTELHYLLNNYPVKYYDASYQKYGLGATEVYIYQNSY